MDTVTAIITALVLGTAIGYNASTGGANQTPVVESPTCTSCDTIDFGGPPPTFDEREAPVGGSETD